MPLIIGFACLSFLQVGVMVLLTKCFGAVPTYSVFAVPTIIGLLIQWGRKPIMQAALARTEGFSPRGTYEQQMRFTRPSAFLASNAVWIYWVSVVLLAIPGPLTAIIAFSLMSPCGKAYINKEALKLTKARRRALQKWKREQPPPEKPIEVAGDLPASREEREQPQNRKARKRRKP